MADLKLGRQSLQELKESTHHGANRDDEELGKREPACSVTFEFKIDGMTCVSCSSCIERGLHAEFKNKGLVLD